MAAVAELNPATAPPAPITRPRVVMMGTALASGGTLMFFAGLLAIYLSQRAAVVSTGSDWLPEGVAIPLLQANIGFATLALSSVTMAWAVNAIANDDRRNAYLAIGTTLLLGVAYLNLMNYFYVQMKWDITTSSPAVIFYAITTSHIVMVVVAMIFLGLMGFRALGGQFTSRQHDGISAAALFWHSTVAIYAIIWFAIYVTK
jgi:cytochrome c oxidase subunit 3